MAIITISNTGGNWNATTAWVGGVVPTVADDVIATVLSGPLSLNVSTAVAKSVNFTNYVNTLSLTTVNGALNIAGNLTLSAGMTITGTAGTFAFTTNATWTSNGKTWTGNYIVNTASLTITLADNAIIGGNTTHSSGGGVHTFNGSTISFNGNITASSGRVFAGTTTYRFTTATTQAITGTFQSDVVIIATGTVTLTNLIFTPATNKTITYTSGIIPPGTGALALAATGALSVTLNTSGMSWNNISNTGNSSIVLLSALNVSNTSTLNNNPTFVGAFPLNTFNLIIGSSGGILTMSNDINVTGTLSSGLATGTTFNGAYTINALNSVTVGQNWSGTAVLLYTGTGTFTGGTAASILQLNTFINTTGATFGSFTYRTKTLTWTAIGTSTFGSMVLALNNVPTMSVNCTGLVIPTLSMNAVSTNTTINGSQGFVITNYLCTSAASTKVTWQVTNVYIINNSFTVTTTLLLTHTWVSSSPGTQYTVTLTNGATCDVAFMTVTDADSSLGATVWVYKPVSLTNTLNWKALPTQPHTISYTS
jgi:hypothetical protein